jgi:soluble lytic murein transglycosylase
LPEEPEVNGDSAQEFNGQELVAVIRLLAGIDEQSRLKPFVMKLSEISDERGWKSLAAKLARQNGRRDLSVRIAKAASRAGIRMLQSGYPLINLPAMSKKAQAKRPETPLTLAVIRQESAFQENARSHAKAQGLMQLMPATAKKMSRALKLRYSRRKLTNDPVYNLTLGQAYLGRVIDRYDGSYVLALAAYNAGPARVKQWLRRNGDPRGSEVDAIDWVELIPISETRNYVQRVLENLQVYRMRLAKTEIALSLDSDLHN